MRVYETAPLFAWECLEDSPSLRTIREFLSCIPDGKLLDALRLQRGKGRDDYTVSVLWGTLLLTVLLRYPTTEACLGELRRNPSLRRLIDIDSEAGVPKPWNMSRFLTVLGTEPYLSMMREIFDEMVRRLAAVVPDLGRDTAGDASHLSARRVRSTRAGKEGGLPMADGGRKEYTDEQGKVVNVLEWFGYKFHLLVDRKHEVVLAYQISSTHVGDTERVKDLVEEATRSLPGERIKTLAYDKAADAEEVHEYLHAEGISPLIQMRSLWKEESERVLPGADGRDNVVYDEAGTLYCYDRTSRVPVRHRMAYCGHEQSRGTLKYRCPAVHEGWRCPHQVVCNRGKKYGKTVRVKREIDLRRFPPIPRATKTFERLYKGRTACERVNARLKIFWGTDDGNITGARRFYAHVSAVMLVHIGLATVLASTPRPMATLGTTRLSPIADALRRKWQT